MLILMPSGTFSAELEQRISHRLSLRMEMLNERIKQNQKLRQDADANAAILEYLGKPVPPPADMDAADSKKGLTDVIELAARNAGITVNRIEIDDSEFPFVIGVVCQPGDLPKLGDQLYKLNNLNGNRYGGGLGAATWSTFYLKPLTKFSDELGQRFHHRMNVRQEMLSERIK
jgi:hypothetical protein